MQYLQRAPAGAGRLRARRRGRPLRSSMPPTRGASSTSSSRAADGREVSTTMAFVRLLAKLLRDKKIGQLDRADRARRGAHLRHGGALPPGRHLLARRPALRAGRLRHAALLPRGQGRADPRGGHHRGRRDVLVHRRRHRLRDPRRQHDPVLHLLLDVRLPADRRPDLGGRRHARAGASCSAARPAGPRWPARGCSTRTATATCSPARCPTSRPTTRPTPTSWRSSSGTASGGCTASRRTSSTTSR